MKPTHLINELKELIEGYSQDYLPDRTKSQPRNAICVTTYTTPDDTAESENSRDQVLKALQTLFDTPIPILPDLESTADESDQIRAVLGQEFPAMILDCTQSWPDNTLGAAAGCIKAPGTLILLMPNGLNFSDEDSAYEIHLKRTLKKHMPHESRLPGVWSIHPRNAPGSMDAMAEKQAVVIQQSPWQQEQSSVVESLVRRCDSEERSMDLLLAKRGRGKSAALGLLIKHLNQRDLIEAASEITLTASHSNQIITAQKHALPVHITHTPLDLALRTTGNILIVDEAGSVPLPVLKQLSANYSHTVLAGTVDGYEGSGRALAVRLASVQHNTEAVNTSEKTPSTTHLNTQTHTLHHPIRWQTSDPVEAMVQDVLRLGLIEPQNNQAISFPQPLTHFEHQIISSRQLLSDKTLLDDVFGLLMQAHYQTTSKDLKHLLNQEQLTLWVQRHKGTLTGACLIAHEGALNQELQEGIKQGKRRPAHQKLPMLLYRQCNKESVLSSHHWRIVRIAIKPAFQGNGLGRCFLNAIRKHAIHLNAKSKLAPDFIGATFGATEAGFNFWHNAQFQAIHWGFKLNPRSGQRALAVILPVQEHELVMHAHKHFVDNAITLKDLHYLNADWFSILYNEHLFDERLLSKLIASSAVNHNIETLHNPSSDEHRLQLWKNNQLGLHDIWGPLARKFGGTDKLSNLKFPNVTTAKQLTKQLKTIV